MLATTTANKTAVVVSLNMVSLQVDYSCFSVMNFDGILIHGLVLTPGVVGATTYLGCIIFLLLLRSSQSNMLVKPAEKLALYLSIGFFAFEQLFGMCVAG